MTISEQLYARRVELGEPRRPLPLAEAAAQIGVSVSTLSRVEQGKDCRATVWVKIQKWLQEPR